MLKNILIYLMVIYCYSVSSQHSSVSGMLKDSKTNTPVIDAIISLSPNSLKASSDSLGYYNIGSIVPGDYTLFVRHIGFSDYKVSFSIERNKNLRLNIFLEPNIESLGEVVIEDDRLDNLIISKLPFVETKFTRIQIQREATRDVTDFLRSSKNINGIRKGGTQLDPVVRGFKYSQLNVQLNGAQKIEGGCPNRMDPATAHVEIEDVESIEVIKGPYALKYGPMFGGLINLKTEIPPHTDSSYVHLKALMAYESNWNGNKQHLNVYGGYKWFYYNFSGGRKDFGNYTDGNGNKVNSEFSKYNYKGQLGFIPAKNHMISLNFEESKGRNILFPSLPMDERSDDTRLMSLNYQGVDIGESLKSIKLMAYNSDVRHEMDNKNRPFSDTVVAVSVIEAINRGLRLESGFKVATGDLIVGLNLENVKKDGDRDKNMITQPGLPVKKEKLWNNAEINNLGVFTEYTQGLKTWEFSGALRLDWNQASSDEIVINHPVHGEIYKYGIDSIKSEYLNFSFSLGISKSLSEKWTVSLALGRGVRSPDMTERFIILLPIGYDKFDYLGNPQLQPEANNQVDLTFKYTNEKLGLFQGNGFYSLVNNYITGKRIPPVDQKPLTKDVLGVKQFYNAGNARLRGFEIAYATPYHHKLGSSVFASYTYGTLDQVLKYTMNENGEVTGDEELQNDALTEIPPFEATISLYYRMFSNKFIPKFDFRMVSSQNHISEASYEQSTPAFLLANFSLSYQFNSFVYLSTGVHNIFDAAYYEHLNRNIIGSSNNFYEPGRSFYFNLQFSF